MIENKIKNYQLAVLITCHNRKTKTLACLRSLYNCTVPEYYSFSVFLVDDGSTDGTSEIVQQQHPQINIIDGDGSLYWAGGMRKAWKVALQHGIFDAYLLLNDDVELEKKSIEYLLISHKFSLKETGKSGIYVGSTAEKGTNQITYGGHLITKNNFVMRSKMIHPTDHPQACHFANANILWVSQDVVERIGILNKKFTHGIADFDYTLFAFEKKIPQYVTPSICGYCKNDHTKNWLSSTTPLHLRIQFLKSINGLAYKEYLYYIRKHFILFYPYSFTMLWLKTLFPLFWDQSKKKNPVVKL